MNVYVIGSSLTLDDLCQLQSLLSHEHQKRENYVAHHNRFHNHPIHHHKPIRFRHAMTPAVAQREQERLQAALEHLKVLKEQYRRQRTLQIQAYLENYRRQELIRAVLLEEEERYYRQCISAALEQRRVNSIFNQYLLQRQIQQQQQQAEGEIEERLLHNKGEEMTSEQQRESIDVEKQEKEYSEYHSQQLAELLKQIFNHQPVYDNSENDTEKDMADVWQFVSGTPSDETTSSTVAHPKSIYDHQHKMPYDKNTQDIEKLQENMEQTRIGKGKEEEEEEEETNLELEQTQPSEIKESENKKTHENSDESDTESLPPLQDHVLTLQDLINKLSSEPVMVGEQYIAPEPVKSNCVHYPGTDTLQPSEKQIPEYFVDQSESDSRDHELPATFMPQNVITDAEPTPTIEQSINDVDKEISDFVDSIAAKQKEDSSFVSTDLNQGEEFDSSRKAAKSDITYQSGNSGGVPISKPESQQQVQEQDQSHIDEHILDKDQQIEEQELPEIAEPSTNAGVDDALDNGAKERISANFNPLEELHSVTTDAETIQERDPAKQHLYEKLDQIENQLNSEDVKSRLENILKSKLTFSKQNGGTLLLSASTPADREFLGLEDELMRIMLKLDAIDSNGDEAIRNHRRNLVKRCEAMLDKLDQHKQKEWEKAVKNKHHRNHHSHKRQIN